MRKSKKSNLALELEAVSITVADQISKWLSGYGPWPHQPLRKKAKAVRLLRSSEPELNDVHRFVLSQDLCGMAPKSVGHFPNQGRIAHLLPRSLNPRDNFRFRRKGTALSDFVHCAQLQRQAPQNHFIETDLLHLPPFSTFARRRIPFPVDQSRSHSKDQPIYRQTTI